MYNKPQVGRSARPAPPRLSGVSETIMTMTTTTTTTAIMTRDLSIIKGKVEALSKKAVRNGFGEVKLDIGLTRFETDQDGIPVSLTEISLSYPALKLPGDYAFMGSIDHTDEANIVREAPGQAIPAQYWKSDCTCDHCGVNRRRNSTFIFKSENGDFRQVGSSCLELFFGINPIKSLTVLREIREFTDECEKGFGGNGDLTDVRVDIVELLSTILVIIDRYGYVSRKASEEALFLEKYLPSTHVRAQAVLFPRTNDDRDFSREITHALMGEKSAYEKRAADLLVWGMEYFKTPQTGYEYNMSVLVNQDEVSWKNTGLLSSIVPAFRRANETKTGDYIGQVGDKITATVTVKTISAYSGNYGVTYGIKMTDHEGNSLVWYASSLKPEFRENALLTIKGTIKTLKETGGVKQTILTRCKTV